MVLVHQYPFTVSRYLRQQAGDQHIDLRLFGGPVLPVTVRCQSWQAGEAIPAEAFLDLGADSTLFSLRWIAEHSTVAECPTLNHAHQILDPMSIEIERQILPVPVGAQVRKQGDPAVGWKSSNLWQDALEMPGYEDILLGRDFLRANELVFLVDFREGWFSLLHPHDADNLLHRDRVIAAFAPSRSSRD